MYLSRNTFNVFLIQLEIWRQSCDAAGEVPVPEGALDLPVLKSQPEPLERELYVDLVVSRALRIEVQLPRRPSYAPSSF